MAAASRWLTGRDGTEGIEKDGEASVPIQVRPGGTEAHQDPSRAHRDFGSDFDEQAPPGAGVAFAERVRLAAAREVAAARGTVECFGGHVVRRGSIAGRWR